MTKLFNVNYTCQHCGKQTSCESGFGRWMRNHPALDSVNGIVMTDLDFVVLRYKTYFDGRDFQLMMIVEVKEHGKDPDPAQVDVLSFLRQLAETKHKTIYGTPTVETLKLYSKKNGHKINFRFYGVHLLQFEKTSPNDSAWIKWDRKIIDANTLVGILAMERRPDDPQKWMIEYLRNHHKKEQHPLLFDVNQD
jgi:hypothetical protein